jgi:transposase-like protein
MSTVEGALGGPAIEVVAKATRRRFTVEYKRKIVREADGCRTPGAVSALLRREGLYTSHLATWRAARERGELAGAPKKRVQRRESKNLTVSKSRRFRWTATNCSSSTSIFGSAHAPFTASLAEMCGDVLGPGLGIRGVGT